jgi:predicted secreted hydrolase
MSESMIEFYAHRTRTILLLLGYLLFWLQGCIPAKSKLSPVSWIESQPPAIKEGYAYANKPRSFAFPLDHGPHPDFQTEWWYYTGNLETSEGEHFGYQLTFFRRSLVPPQSAQPRRSSWAVKQVYMAHLALSDIGNSQFYYGEKLSRENLGLAGAQGLPNFQVWLEDWSVTQVDSDRYKMQASLDDIAINLTLEDVKGPILQGNQGYSQKGSQPENASYYISQTRLDTTGSIRVGNGVYEVEGFSWMDHEFSTSALAADQVGWDWYALQLDNNYEIMFFTLRHADGGRDPHSSGTLITPEGKTLPLLQEDVVIHATSTWKSPHSGAEYPLGWTLEIPAHGIALQVVPFLQDQELNLSFTYWEGAVRVIGTFNQHPVQGNGYVELTGYAHSMQGQF